MKSIIIFPGSMEAIGQALDIFGEKRVEPGAWNEPVRVNGVTDEEVASAEVFFGALGCEVKEAREAKAGSDTNVLKRVSDGTSPGAMRHVS